MTASGITSLPRPTAGQGPSRSTSTAGGTLAAYKQTVLTAVQEVQSALVAYAREQRRRAALIDAVAADQRSVPLATRRYDQGLTDFLNVLVAQGSLFASQEALVQSHRDVATDAVALYKALGGGWEIGETPAETPPAAH